MPHTTVFRGLDHSLLTPFTGTNIPSLSSTVVTWTRGAVYFVYSFNEIQSQERGCKTSLQIHRESPQVLLNLEIIASAIEGPLRCLLLKSSSSLPFHIHYHTMRNKDSGSMCPRKPELQWNWCYCYFFSKHPLIWLLQSQAALPLSAQLTMEHRILTTVCKSIRSLPGCFSPLPHPAFPLSVTIYIFQ